MAATGQAKVQLILELKERLKTGFIKAKETVNSNISEIKSKLSDVKSSAATSFNNMFSGFSLNGITGQFTGLKVNAVKAMQEIRNEIPLLDKGFRLLKNPIVLAASAIIGIGAALNSWSIESEAFNKNFRQLQMLNLDKPVKEMERLKRVTKDTAFDKGFDINQTATAFFDVQSITGQYGNEVKKIVSKQGEFAMLMQADFNSWIEGTAKAMANYGFGADRLDEFNRAAFATVKTGVTTFDQLSKVMSVYAGSASSAKQDFAAANKMFSLFTVKVKSVDEAATLTKSLFNDLTRKSTIDAFKKIGINVYNNNGQMKQADSLLLELSEKFKRLGNNDKALIDLKNQFSGSEGLTSFIQTAMGSTEQLQSMINNFDATGLDLSKALKIAEQSSDYLKTKLENNLKNIESQIGEVMLPFKEEWANAELILLTKVRDFLKPESAAQSYIDKGREDILGIKEYSDIINNPGNYSSKQYDEILNSISDKIADYEIASKHLGKYEATIYQYLGENFATIRKVALKMKGGLQTLYDLYGEINTARKQVRNNENQLINNDNIAPDDKSKDTSLVNESPIEQITGNAKQIRNLTINIDSFVKGGINTENTTMQNMDARELEEWFTKMMMRVVRNTELSY